MSEHLREMTEPDQPDAAELRLAAAGWTKGIWTSPDGTVFFGWLNPAGQADPAGWVEITHGPEEAREYRCVQNIVKLRQEYGDRVIDVQRPAKGEALVKVRKSWWRTVTLKVEGRGARDVGTGRE